MQIETKFEKIKREQGIEAARAYMRSLRAKVDPKNIKGRPVGSKKKPLGSEAEG